MRNFIPHREDKLGPQNKSSVATSVNDVGELDVIDRLCEKYGLTRSGLLRQMVKHCLKTLKET